MAAPLIQATNLKSLSTVHENFVEPIENLFNIWNGDNPDIIGGYNETTKCIQQFLGDALAKNKTVRVLGGNWSWTKVGFAKDWIVSTTRLNRMKRLMPAEIDSSQTPFVTDNFFFAQCGCSVKELSRVLESLGRSLQTSGASNGQTIAGLISNCTHGSAIDFGATPEFVVGLHIVVSPGKHVYLERASRPVVTDIFIQKIGAELIRDDILFNAALVSFGCFGFIHGVMIETAPL
ncbi:MAG: FAD-binding protein, partial [Bacteroidota bacterium]|nr:FAD-binding protein [Bacteroidota bacterium]